MELSITGNAPAKHVTKSFKSIIRFVKFPILF